MYKVAQHFFIQYLLLISTATLYAADRTNVVDNFRMHCAVCHGDNGQPDPSNPMIRSIGTMPADFTDALFNSREPAGDWFMVIKYGGAALGLSEMMPSFQEVLSDQEIEALVAYAKTLAGSHDFPSGDMNFTLPIRTKKAFPEDEVVWKFRIQNNHNDSSTIKNALEIEKRFGTRFQLSAELAHEFEDGDETFDEFEPGIKYVLYHDKKAQGIVSIGSLLGIPLKGDGKTKIVPYLAGAYGLSETVTLQSTLRADLPLDSFNDGSLEFSSIVHWLPSPWPRSIVPALEFVSSFPLNRKGIERNPLAQLSLIPQLQYGLSKGGHVAINLGAEIPVNNINRYDYRFYMYLIWDFADGSIFSGW